MPIHIDPVRVRDLHDFAEDFLAHAETQPIAPITRHRAFAHAANPNAGEDDVGLYVAYDGRQCVGYLGLLPARLADNGTVHAVDFVSTFYVSPEYRRRHVAFTLLKQIDTPSRDIIVTGFTEEAGILYAALGWSDMGDLQYASLTSEHWRACMACVWPEGAVELSLAHVVSEHARYGGHVETPRFQRDGSTINWMLRHPWVKEGGVATEPAYHFSDVRPMFRQFAVSVKAAGGSSGTVVLSLSRKDDRIVLRLLDYEGVGPRVSAAIVYAALAHAAEHGVHELQVPDEIHRAIADSRLPIVETTTHHRKYLCRRAVDGLSVLPRDQRSLHLSYCDGDTAFT